MVKADLETQIEGLKVLHKEVEDYRTIKRLLITDNGGAIHSYGA